MKNIIIKISIYWLTHIISHLYFWLIYLIYFISILFYLLGFIMIIIDIVKNLYSVYDQNTCLHELTSKISSSIQKMHKMIARNHTLEQVHKDVEIFIKYQKVVGILLVDSVKQTVINALKDVYTKEERPTQRKLFNNINSNDLYTQISYMNPNHKISLDKFYTFFILELPFILCNSINNTLYQNKSLYEKAIRRDNENLNTKLLYSTHLSDIHNIKELTGLDTEDILFDLKAISSDSNNAIKKLVSQYNKGMLNILEHIIQKKCNIESEILPCNKKDFKDFILEKCKNIDSNFTDLKTVSRSLNLKHFTFDYNPSNVLSRYKIKKVETILNDINKVNTIWLMISLYLVLIRQTLKRIVPDTAISTENTPNEIDFYLAIAAYETTLKIIKFIKSNNKNNKDENIPTLNEYIFLLNEYIKGAICALICSNCGQPYFVVNNCALNEAGTNLLRFKCPICTFEKKRISSYLAILKN